MFMVELGIRPWEIDLLSVGAFDRCVRYADEIMRQAKKVAANADR